MSRALPILVCLALAISPFTAHAEAQAQTPRTLPAEAPALHGLLQAIGLYDVLDIMATEGLDYAEDLETDMFPGQGGPAWRGMVAQVYSSDRLVADFESAFPRDALSEGQIADLTAFFTTEPGTSIIEGEIFARREIMRPEVEEAVNAIYRERLLEGDDRLDLLGRFIEVNDLIDLNVAGALNSNYAFYRGLVDGGAFEEELPENLMLSEVWGQEAQIREDTTLWLYSYQLLAYDDLSDADLEAYIALSETEAGRAMNRALFTAFDAMFEAVSHDLGRAAAVFIAGEET